MCSESDIADSEVLLRKISVNSGWYDAEQGEVRPLAFKPRPEDTAGISVDRCRTQAHPEFRSIEQAAVGPSARGYYVALLGVGDLRNNGFTVVEDPLDDNPGHALITDINYAIRKSTVAKERMLQLAQVIVQEVRGPFQAS